MKMVPFGILALGVIKPYTNPSYKILKLIFLRIVFFNVIIYCLNWIQ